MNRAGSRRPGLVGASAVAAMTLAMPAAAAAVAVHAPRPTVIAIHASPATVGHVGGRVTVSATVRSATSCRFTSQPGLHGLPAKVSCSSGHASRSVWMPANNGVAPASYKLTVTAAGTGGTSAPRSTTVRVMPPPPTAALAAGPNGLTKAGGTAFLTATVRRSSSCALSVTPELPGFPAALSCLSGATAVKVTKAVTLPALAGSTATTYKFTLTVTGPGGKATASATETVWPAMTFSVAASITSGSFTSVSCPTTTFCAATLGNGKAYFYNGAHWTAQSALSGVPIVSISCTSATFCMAVDDSTSSPYGSGAWIWNGKTWSGSLPGIYLTSVSCTSPTFCMVIGNLNPGVYASAWNGTSWTPQAEIDSPAGNSQVSCASPTFCAVVDDNGDAITFNGKSWSSPDSIDAGVLQPLAAVSCRTATFCMALDGFGQAFKWTGTAWTGPTGVEADAGVTAVSCPSTAFCVAADISGNVVTYYSGTWSTPDPADPQPANVFNGFTTISCATVAFCAGLDASGNVSLGTG